MHRVVEDSNEKVSSADIASGPFEKFESAFREVTEDPVLATGNLGRNARSLETQNRNGEGELLTEKTLSYFTQEKKPNGENIIHQLVSHEISDFHTSNVQAPFATDFDGPEKHLPAINPVSFINRAYEEDQDVPPPKKVVLSKALRKKVERKTDLFIDRQIALRRQIGSQKK